MNNLSITEQNGTLTLQITPNTKSKRKLAMIKNMCMEMDYITLGPYLRSLEGKYASVDLDRLECSGTDIMKGKATGTVLNMFNEMLNLEKAHKPTGAETDWIGVEIECFIPYDSLGGSVECDMCHGQGYYENDDGDDIDCKECEQEGHRPSRGENWARNLKEKFKSRKIKYSNLKHDGSIEGDDDCFEIEITVMTRLSNPENLRRACTLLNELGAKVNKTCGLHVHLDARHLGTGDVRNIGRNFDRALPVMLGMVPASRREGNEYCEPRVGSIDGGRYYAVNLSAYKKYRTVEIRLHSSTTNFDKIIHWAKLCSAIAKADNIKRYCTDISELSEHISIDEQLMEYIAQRTALFNGGTCTAETLDSDSTERLGA